MSGKKPGGREAMFCRYLAALGDPREAAVLAGFKSNSRNAAAKLITRADIAKECEQISKNLPRHCITARQGLERLAFGSVGDALELLYIDESLDLTRLQYLDLFCVSEIKRPKSGGVEIKFYDRLKALTILLENEENHETPGADSLFRALEATAALCGAGDCGED